VEIQEEEEELEETEGKHNIAFILGHARIGQARNQEGEKEFLSVPSIAIDYNYWISDNFLIGLHSDILNENFFIESEKNGDLIERERPITLLIAGGYKIGRHWVIGLGTGGEFVKGKNYFVTRISIEYGVEIRNGWEVFGTLNQDFRANVYNITSFGIGIGKRL
jgi:hypothetical protein